jgi:hypothetical protein
MKSKEEIDQFTREIAKHDPCEDPFCCTPVREELANKVRLFFGLPELTDDELHSIQWPGKS